MINLIDEKSLEILSEAIQFCNSIKLYGCIYTEDESECIEFDHFKTQNWKFEPNFDLKIEFCRENDRDDDEDSYSKMNVKEFIDLYSHINDYKIDKNYNVYGKNIALFLVSEADNYTTAKFLQEPIDNWCHTTVNIDSDEYTVEFVSKRQVIFDILLLKEKNYYNDLPVLEMDYFIKVSSNDKLDEKIAEELAEALIFELSTNHKINLVHSTRMENFDFYSVEIEKNLNVRMFPLLTGAGMSEVIKLFNKSIDINDLDYKILALTKVIEYIAPTVTREKLNTCILQKLSSPRVLNPDADYVLELQKTFEEHRQYQKDCDMIKVAILEIVDFDEIKQIIPAFLHNQNKTSKENRQEILQNLSQSISDTRNYIAHAKANYTNKGLECPESEKQIFIQILTIIARQFIRWFHNQSPSKRVLKS